MRRCMTLLMVLGVSVLLWTAPSYATVLTAVLDGPSEFPANPSPGTGTALVELDTAAHTMLVSITFSGLVSPTSAAHIHCCVSPDAAVPTASVATTTPSFPGFPLGVTSGSYSMLFDTTLASTFRAGFITANGGTPAGAEAALAAGLLNGEAYANIHTSMSPGGEIRGFLVVPEPASFFLLGLASAGLVFARRHGTL